MSWFKTRRALIAECVAQADLINEQRIQLDDLERRLEESRSLLEQARRLSEQRADQLNRLRHELRELRDEIAEYERGRVPIAQPEPVRGQGLAIFPPYTRRQREAIDDHAADKRREDV